MSYKPDERAWMDYLYGEMNEEERAHMLRYLNEHPEAQQELQHLKEVVGALGRVEDQEVIAPPVFMDNERPMDSFWRSTAFRTVASMAASFLLLLVAARLLGLQVSYGERELRIGFGERNTEVPSVPTNPAPASLTEAEVQQLINASLARNTRQTEEQLAASQKQLDKAIRANLAANSQRIDQLVREASQASQDQVRTFVAGLQSNNLQLMKDYLQLSASEQKTYMENLLVDFSKYLQEQRNQDLQMFQTRFSTIEQNTDIFKQETEQILTSIINQGDAGRKQSNY